MPHQSREAPCAPDYNSALASNWMPTRQRVAGEHGYEWTHHQSRRGSNVYQTGPPVGIRLEPGPLPPLIRARREYYPDPRQVALLCSLHRPPRNFRKRNFTNSHNSPQRRVNGISDQCLVMLVGGWDVLRAPVRHEVQSSARSAAR